MKKLMNLIKDYQQMNVEEGGIVFAEENFTQLYEEALEASVQHISDVQNSGVKGLLLGAAGVGVTWLGVEGVKKWRKHNRIESKKKKKREIEEQLEEQLEEQEPKAKATFNKKVDLKKARTGKIVAED